jgi:hypothetical protein
MPAPRTNNHHSPYQHTHTHQVTWLHDICIQMKQALQQAAYLQLDQQYHAAAGLIPPPVPIFSAASSYAGAAPIDSSKLPLGSATAAATTPLPNNQNNHHHLHHQQHGNNHHHSNSHSHALSSQSSFVSAAAPYNYPPPPAPAGLARGLSNASTTSRGGAPVAAGAMGMAAGAAALSDAPSEEVGRALLAELELTKLRMRSAGVLSRVQALLDVLEVGWFWMFGLVDGLRWPNCF